MPIWLWLPHPRKDTLMTDKERYYWDLNGHLVVRNVLTPKEVKAANDAIDYLADRCANGTVQIVKNRASGFRTLDAFSDMICLTVGDLNIPEQIPKRFRTL